MPDKNKIATELSPKDLLDFCDDAWKTPNLTLKKFQELAAERGINVSLMGARTFRDTTFKRHLERIGKAAELREQMREAVSAGNSIADAAALVISDEVFDKLVNRDIDEEVDLDVLSKIIKRLRDSDRGKQALEHRIALDRDEVAKRVLKDPALLAEVAKIKADGSISDAEKAARVSRRLFGDKPADFKPHTATRDEA
jgi:hypothetical protein